MQELPRRGSEEDSRQQRQRHVQRPCGRYEHIKTGVPGVWSMEMETREDGEEGDLDPAEPCTLMKGLWEAHKGLKCVCTLLGGGYDLSLWLLSVHGC